MISNDPLWEDVELLDQAYLITTLVIRSIFLLELINSAIFEAFPLDLLRRLKSKSKNGYSLPADIGRKALFSAKITVHLKST